MRLYPSIYQLASMLNVKRQCSQDAEVLPGKPDYLGASSSTEGDSNSQSALGLAQVLGEELTRAIQDACNQISEPPLMPPSPWRSSSSTEARPKQLCQNIVQYSLHLLASWCISYKYARPTLLFNLVISICCNLIP